MRKAVLLVIVLAILFSGCNSMDIIDEALKNSESNSEETEGSVNLDYFDSGSAPLCRPGDMENNINAERISEDIDITEKAREYDITEYDVLIDAIDSDILPQCDPGGDNYEILDEYSTGIPQETDLNTIYDMYNVAFDYIIAMTDNINIRSAPVTSSQVIGMAHSLEKINVISKIKGQFLDSYDSDTWYQIAWNDIDTMKNGYIFGGLVEVRTFNFASMIDSIKRLEREIDGGIVAYVDNYKDRKGEAPLYNGEDRDNFGTKRYQSAPAYYKASTNSEFRYIPDGMIVTLVDETKSFFRVMVPAYKEEYYIPKSYLSIRDSIENLKQVVVVDRTNQNEAVFQCFEDRWQIVSYTYATTGGNESYSYPTEEGFYMVMGMKERLEYTDDNGTPKGFAPYAVRFSGSSYIHGIPVDYEQTDDGETDTELMEYLFTLGTFPRSNGTVRNYTSHAQFLYEWLVIGESAVIVIE